MNLSQQLVFIAVFVASAVATASAAGNNYLRHHPVMTESAIATSDGDADADAGDEDEDVADRMAALIIFNGVELKCRPTNALCSSSSQCCTGE